MTKAAHNNRLLQDLQTQLKHLEDQHLLRKRRTLLSPADARVQTEERELLAFCSNDYLGLANHPQLIAALQEGAALYGAGSGASHLISGHSLAHEKLEQDLADWYAPLVEDARALYFCTGYMANQAMVSAMAQGDATVFSEALNHASLIDGARLSRAQVQVFPHLNYQKLEQQLKACKTKVRVVITDSVFSMDGNIANLPELLRICEANDAWLIVDDAHGFGVLGEQGRGVLEHYALRSPQLIYMGTLGKAAGVSGAFVLAHSSVIEWLIQKARSYIYTTAAAPALAHAVSQSLRIIAGPEGQQRRAHLHKLIAYFREQLDLQSWQLMPSQTAIQPIIIGENADTLRAGSNLLQQGYWVGAIRPPTVAKGSARLRVCLSAAHQLPQVQQLALAINRLDQMAYVANCFAEVF